jgi:hypothetical protein
MLGMGNAPKYELMTKQEKEDYQSGFKEHLQECLPKVVESTISMHYSDAFYVYNNEDVGINLKEIILKDEIPDDFVEKVGKHIIEKNKEKDKNNGQAKRSDPLGRAKGYKRSLEFLLDYVRGKSINATSKKQKISTIKEIDKFEIINKAFRIMLPPLSLYIGNTLIYKDNANWWTRFVINKLSESAVSNLPQNGNFDDLVKSLDIQACLLLIINNWKDIFQKKLNNNNHLNWAHELKTLRNEIDAHYTSKTLDTFNYKALERGIDTMALFMEPINKDISVEIKSLYK